MAKMTGEFKSVARAPADFVASWILDIHNWRRMTEAVPVVGKGLVKLAWDGEPWRLGSAMVMKTGLIKVRLYVVEPAPGELCRYEQRQGLPFARQVISYTYAVRPLSASSCELIHSMYFDGIGAKIVPTFRRSSADSARAWRVIEEDWERAGKPMSTSPSGDVEELDGPQAPDDACRRCGSELSESAAFCHNCGAPVGAA